MNILWARRGRGYEGSLYARGSGPPPPPGAKPPPPLLLEVALEDQDSGHILAARKFRIDLDCIVPYLTLVKSGILQIYYGKLHFVRGAQANSTISPVPHKSPLSDAGFSFTSV
jgi:hypothetical protein